MILQCLGAFAPFLLITFGPWLVIRIVIRPTLLRRLMLWAWRTWFVGLMLVIGVVVGGALTHTDAGASVSENIFSGSAGFSSSQKNSAIQTITASGVAPAEYLQLVYSVADELGHPIEAELMMGIIQQESAWNPDATSPAGAMGLAQLMPDTASDMGVSNPYDPEQSIRGGMKYISFLLNYYSGDLETAVMAYHAGPGNMNKRGATSLDRYYAQRVLGFYDDYKAKANMGQLLHAGVGVSEQIGPLYEYAALSQGLHEDSAIDLWAGAGTPLYSPISGTITNSYLDGLGNTVLIIENEYYRIKLLHGDYIGDRNDKVQQGDLIGFEDNNGNTWSGGKPCYGRNGCGEHSHISIFDKRAERQVNPLQFQIVKQWHPIDQ